MIVACSKENIAPPPSAENKLVDIIIPKSYNPGFTDDGFTYAKNNHAYITLPLSADPSQVYMDFKISEKATLTLDDIIVSELAGTFDLSSTVKAVITSESGSSRLYYILAQPGIKEFDQIFYEFKEAYDIPGISFAISKTSESKIVYKSGIGFSDKEEMIRTTPDQLFRLGSISKQFTSICIMKLIEQGEFSVESKVFGSDGILGEEYGEVAPLAAKVTIRNLLDHTSGWDVDPDPMFSGNFSGQPLGQRIQYVLDSPQTEPGTRFAYFNMGYGILGRVIEVVTGEKFEVFLKEVLAEANITDIHVGGDRNQRRPNEVVYYSQDGYDGYVNEMEIIAAAGGLIATTEEMMQLIPYIDGQPDIPDLLKPETRALMLSSPHSDSYALGWRMNHRLFPGAWYHGGNLAGTATFWMMGPEYSTVILCNSRSYLPGFGDEFYYLTENLINIAARHF